MVDHHDPGPLRPTTELGVEPAVVLAPDLALALADVGLGGVDRHDPRAAPATSSVVTESRDPKKSSKCR